MNRSVVILGMHRSGTSALAGVLRLAGLDLGPNLMQGRADNPQGFFEHEAISELHQKLLITLGSDWDDIRSLPDGWRETPDAAATLSAIADIIRTDFASSPLWGVKDPRLCRLFALWPDLIRAAGAEPFVILALRHPLEVARSLNKRNGLGLAQALALWLRYTLEAEAATRPWPRVVQDYELLLSDWRAELERLDRALGLGLPARTHDRDGDITSFLDSGLRHHRITENRPEGDDSQPFPSWCLRAYAAMSALPDRSAQDSLDALAAEFRAWERNAGALCGQLAYHLAEEHRQNKVIGWLESERLSLIAQNRKMMAAGQPPSDPGAVAKPRGHVDRIDRQGVEGWAFSPDEPARRVALEVVVDDIVVQTVIADRLREGLAEAGIGDGRHSFAVAFAPVLSSEIHHVVRVRRSGDGSELEGSGVTLEPEKARGDDESIRFYVDSPIISDGRAELSSRHTLLVEGWAIGRWGIAGVEIFLDDAPLGAATHGLPRQGLEAAFPDYPEALHGGFAFSASRRPADGEHKLAVVIKDRRGESRRVEFTLDVPPAGRGPAAWDVRRQIGQSELALKTRSIAAAGGHPTYLMALKLPDLDRQTCERARVTLASLRRQVYPAWRVMIIQAEPSEAFRAALMDGFDDIAARVVPTKGDTGWGRAEPGGVHVVPLREGDRLGVDALLELALGAGGRTDADFFYCDECRIDPSTAMIAPYFKPDWSPALLLSTNYVGRLWVASAGLLQRAGVKPADLAAGSEYDLVLRITEQAAAIVHLPRILCARGPARLDTAEQEYDAVRAAMARRGIEGEILPGCLPGIHRLKRRMRTEGLVSIVIPTAGTGGVVKAAITSLRQVTHYRRFEIIVIDNIPAGESAVRQWVADNADTVLRLDGPFNWSRCNNLGVAQAKGEFLLFLNDDVEICQPDWLEALLEHAQEPDVGIVGPQLLYPDGSVQAAGAFLSETGGRNAFRFMRSDAPGPFGLALTQRDVIAVTGACMLVRRAVFEALGGFDEAHAIINNDLDFCLRVHRTGLRTLFTPYASLIHHEKVSRARLDEIHDSERFAASWGGLLARGDPFFSIHLSKSHDDYVPEPEPVETIFPALPLAAVSAVRTILVLKLDQIGDFITAFPACRRLKQHFPDARLTVLATSQSAALAWLEPAIDQVITFDAIDTRATHGDGGAAADPDLQAALNGQLRGADFDLAIDLRRQPETRFLLPMTGARWLVGFDPGGLFPWLDIAVPWSGDAARVGKQRLAGSDLVSAADSVAAAFRANPSAAFLSTAEARDSVAALPQFSVLLSGWQSARIACIHPGAGAENRQWPAAHFAALIDLLVEKEDMRCYVIGASEDDGIIRSVIDGVKRRDAVRVSPGLVSLADLPVMLQACNLFVGNNSGPQHLAAVLGVPTVNVHSGVIDPHEWGGVGPAALSVRRAMTCSPCYQTDIGQCHRELACLRLLTPHDVFGACRIALRGQAIDAA